MIRSRSKLSEIARRQPSPLADRIIESGGKSSPSDSSFWALITGNSDDGDNRWSYTFAEAELTEPGYGNWSAKSGGVTGTARNTLEDMNAETGTLGNGVLVSHLDTADYTFALQPCPTNAIVRMHRVMVGSVITYWFQYANGVDGTCD